jgi:glycerol-3-phosphate O-acyltransferase / dihydroxyacetone phosphate acyltransferase
MGLLQQAIGLAVGWSAAVFYRVERTGGPIPPGPVLVAASHPNALLDPLVIFWTAGRMTRPLAKAPLFEHPVIGPMLRGLGGLPVYRRQDDPAQMDRNEATFAAAVQALRQGDAVQIYPEGQSHSNSALTPLRTGAARIALRAEAEAGWSLGLQIVPVGLTYARKPFFRGRAMAAIGEPFTIQRYRAAYEADAHAAARALTEEITAALEALTLNLSPGEDAELVDTAERIYARQKGLAGWREREALSGRLGRLQAFARGVAWLRTNDPERHGRLVRAVRRYRRQADLLGAGDEADVPPAYPARTVLRYAVVESLLLGLLLPFALLGALAWLLPYLAPRPILRFVQPDHDAIATWKLAPALLAFPAMYAVWIFVAARLGGWPLALGAAALLPILGYAAISWRARFDRVTEDTRLFARVAGRPEHRDRLAAARAALVAEFDAVATLLAERTPGAGDGSTEPRPR